MAPPQLGQGLWDGIVRDFEKNISTALCDFTPKSCNYFRQLRGEWACGARRFGQGTNVEKPDTAGKHGIGLSARRESWGAWGGGPFDTMRPSVIRSGASRLGEPSRLAAR